MILGTPTSVQRQTQRLLLRPATIIQFIPPVLHCAMTLTLQSMNLFSRPKSSARLSQPLVSLKFSCSTVPVAGYLASAGIGVRGVISKARVLAHAPPPLLILPLLTSMPLSGLSLLVNLMVTRLLSLPTLLLMVFATAPRPTVLTRCAPPRKPDNHSPPTFR